MNRTPQFTLCHLLAEVFWIAAALACFSQLQYVSKPWQIALLVYGILFLGLAIGGLFKRTLGGYGLGAALVAAGFVAALMAWQIL